jgi:hypothetical protein
LCAYDVNILGGSVHVINTEALVVAIKEIGQEVNADETKTRVISRDHNAGRSNNITSDNISCERVEVIIYILGQTYQIKIPFCKKLRAN